MTRAQQVYQQLRPLTTLEQSGLHNRISLKQEVLNINIKQDTDKGRIVNSNMRANIGLHWNYILQPCYRAIRESRWKGIQQ
jgi:hypothetical protein